MIALAKVQTIFFFFFKHDYIKYNNMFELLNLVKEPNLLELLNMFNILPKVKSMHWPRRHLLNKSSLYYLFIIF